MNKPTLLFLALLSTVALAQTPSKPAPEPPKTVSSDSCPDSTDKVCDVEILRKALSVKVQEIAEAGKNLADWMERCAELQRENSKLKQQIESFRQAALDIEILKTHKADEGSAVEWGDGKTIAPHIKKPEPKPVEAKSDKPTSAKNEPKKP